jgi:hypothetical protein
MLVTFCDEWVDGRLVARAMRGGGQWSAAEVYRAAGLRHARQGHAAEAEALYRRALDLARAQGAVAWERRAARALDTLRGAKAA